MWSYGAFVLYRSCEVFPKIDRIKEESGGAKKVSQKMQRLDLATLCSREKFEGLVDERVWSFTSKKNLLEGLKMKKKALLKKRKMEERQR